MSKRTDNLIKGLTRRINQIALEVSNMNENVGILNKEPDPELYRRWFLSKKTVVNLEGLVRESLEKLQEYQTYKNLPWWKKIFRRRV